MSAANYAIVNGERVEVNDDLTWWLSAVHAASLAFVLWKVITPFLL